MNLQKFKCVLSLSTKHWILLIMKEGNKWENSSTTVYFSLVFALDCDARFTTKSVLSLNRPGQTRTHHWQKEENERPFITQCDSQIHWSHASVSIWLIFTNGFFFTFNFKKFAPWNKASWDPNHKTRRFFNS